MKAILSLPDGLSKADIEARSSELDQLVWYWLGMMESIGMLVFHRDLDVRVVDNTIGGPVLISWRKLTRYVADARAELQRDSFDEWFQWLAERIAALERDEGRRPAHMREADWKP